MQYSHGRTTMADNATDSLTADMPLLRAGLRIAADSCSLIFLNRLHLLEAYAGLHAIVLTEALYNEITCVPEHTITADDRSLYTKLFAGSLVPVTCAGHSGLRSCGAISVADLSLIQAYHTRKPDGILTDDKELCRYCRKHSIPYINTPMAVFVLLYNGRLTHEQYTAKLSSLFAMGRYGKSVRRLMDEIYARYRACMAGCKQNSADITARYDIL